MELWIRSQNKEILKKCDAVILNGLGLRIIIFGEEPEEYCLTDENDVVLARYKTKERALEVLDEIQNLMTPKIRFNSIISTKKLEKYKSEFIPSNPTIVYEMPKD